MNFHFALAAAKNRGPEVEWWFRVMCPKPGEEQLHMHWIQWLNEMETWPDNFEDGSWQFWMPELWRSRKVLNQMARAASHF